MNVGIVIQSRFSSTRFPGKCFAKIDERPLLYHVINNTLSANPDFSVVLTTSIHESCDPIADYVTRNFNIPVFRGKEDHVLDRYIAVLDALDLDIVVRITGDDPCHIPEVINKGVELFANYSLDYLLSGVAGKTVPDGLVFEVISSDRLRHLGRTHGDCKLTQEHVTLPLRKGFYENHSDIIQRLFADSMSLHAGLSLCVDTLSDIERLRSCWALRLDYSGRYIADTPAIMKKMSRLHGSPI